MDFEAELASMAEAIFRATVAECNAARIVGQNVSGRPGVLVVQDEQIALGPYDEIRVAAIGKAADEMMASFASALDRCGPELLARRGLVVGHAPPSHPPPVWTDRVTGGHPLPDGESLRAGRLLLDLFERCTPRTLAVFLLSGGGSALAEWPADPALGLDGLRELNRALVESGAGIREVNAIRKRVSAIKGGRLGRHAAPADRLTLVLSDVAPGDVQSVASGPTLPDATTNAEVLEMLERTGLHYRVAPVVERLLSKPLPRTHVHEESGRSTVAVLADCTYAAEVATRQAERAADRVVNLGCVDAPVDETIARMDHALGEALSDGSAARAAVISTGEVALRVDGDGRGGRNQHTVLASLARCEPGDTLRRVFLSAGTDGRDGPTDAAGAVAGCEMLETADRLGLDPREFLRRFDATTFFERTGGLVRTGPTGTNLRDLRIWIGARRG